MLAKRKVNTYQAKRIPLKDILAALGHEPSTQAGDELWYRSPFRQEEKPSLQVNIVRNVWYDFGAGAGGNVIEFALRYFQVSSVSEALRQLENHMGGRVSEPLPCPKPVKTRDLPAESISVSKIQSLQNPALIKYLNSRGVDEAIARPYVQEIYYTHNFRKYFALAFPNQSGGYELRNPYFKGAHGHKDISVFDGESDAGVMIFEGFMDFLSALAWYKPPTLPLSVIVLNSVAMREKALSRIRDKGFQKVHLYLDHDTAGRELTASFQQQLAGIEVVDQSGLYLGFKDFNDYLEKQKKRELQQG